MKRTLLFLLTLIALVSLVILQSCTEPPDETQNCGDSLDEYYSLSAAQKAIIPYTGYDTISMVSNTGDTIHCIGTGKQSFNTRVFQPHSHPSCAGYGTEKFYEAYKIEFIDSNKNKKIELAHYEYFLVSPYDKLPIVYISFSGGGGGTIDTHISNINAYNYLGNIEVNNKLYSAVTKAKNVSNDTNTFVYINKTEGIIKLQLSGNETWELIAK